MPRFLDRTNMRYGRLLVIKYAGKDKLLIDDLKALISEWETNAKEEF